MISNSPNKYKGNEYLHIKLVLLSRMTDYVCKLPQNNWKFVKQVSPFIHVANYIIVGTFELLPFRF